MTKNSVPERNLAIFIQERLALFLLSTFRRAKLFMLTWHKHLHCNRKCNTAIK